jgi:glycolate oxidase FAD binding subunit
MQAMQSVLQAFSERIREAAARKKPLRLRGGGTKDFYGQALKGDVLDTRAYHGVISYEPSELVITVRAGTPLAEVEALLAKQGQCLAFEPPHFATANAQATVGGMVAAGLAGAARASVGSVRDFVLGVRMLNGQGQDLTFGGQVMKNVAGYDVSRLMAGSLGTLGMITEVSLKVLPITPAQATLACLRVSQQEALDLLNRWGGQPLPLNASAWLHDTTANPVQDALYVRLRGAQAAVKAAIVRMQADVQAMGGDVMHVDEGEIDVDADWRASGEQTLPFFAQPPSPEACLWRLSVPQTTPALEVPRAWGSPYIEWHGAQRWYWAPASAAGAMRHAAHHAGGHATLFRCSTEFGIQDKAVGVFAPLDAVQLRIQRALKHEFDPAGIFGPGRWYAEL